MELSPLAVFGGKPAVTAPRPHEVWPPQPTEVELAQLAEQRRTDISIRGNDGPTGELEREFLAFLGGGAAYAVTFNSGTSALLAAYFALGVEPSTEVVGPDLTYHAALSPAFALGASVRVADIDGETRCIDPAGVAERITERTRVVTAVHQWGHPCDMDALLALRDRHGFRLLEDCSHAHGSTWRGRPVGTFGDAAVFSLQANKAVFAGEGGILVTSDEHVHDRAVLLGHYRDRSRDSVIDPLLKEFWVTGFGLKLRMSPFNAIVARNSLAAFPDRSRQRHACLNHLSDGLREVSFVEPVAIRPEATMGAWYGYKPRLRPLPDGVTRDLVIRALRAENVEVGVPSGPQLSTQPLYRQTRHPLFPSLTSVRNDPAGQPVAAAIVETALSLPTFNNWPEDKAVIDEYVEAFKKVDANLGRLAPE
jgi:dTDP-4-amino-4,6-dideoxygalactose transaminase